MNISTNLKAIDSLKSGMLCEIARLYTELSDHDAEKDDRLIENGLASVIAMCYMLSKRLGFEYNDIDIAMSSILCDNTTENPNETSCDMELLNKYIHSKRF